MSTSSFYSMTKPSHTERMIAPLTCDSNSEDESLIDYDDGIIDPNFQPLIKMMQENDEF